MVTRYLLLIHITSLLFGHIETGMEQDNKVMKDPHCSDTKCKKPLYDIVNLEHDCKSTRKYARCIKRIIALCRSQTKNLRDPDSIDQLIAEFEAAKNILAITRPGCHLLPHEKLGYMHSNRVEPELTLTTYIALGTIAFLLPR